MNTTKNIIIASLEEALKKLNLKKPIVLTESKNFGDFATNLALTLQKEMGENAFDIANKIVKNIDLKKYKAISKIEVVKPGFINFWVTNTVLADLVNSINTLGENYGSEKKNSKGAINIEFVSANPTGYLHIGHARNAAIGATLCNVAEKAGHRVVREYLVNDYGNQMNNLASSMFARYQQIFNKDFPMPEECYRGGDIIDFAKEFYKEFKDKYKNVEYTDEIRKLFREYGRKLALKNIEKDMERFGVWFDIYTSETEQYEKDLVWPVIRKLKTTYVKDGATWLATTKGGRDDKDRVIIKSNGDSTYLCADIAYHAQKFEQLKDKKNGIIIDIWGADHSGYVERVKFSFEDLGYRRDQIEIILFQLLRVVKDGKEIKMSKRLGTSLTLRELMDLVGKDAIRYFLIDRSYNSKIDFDISKVSSADESNPLFLIKYAHARCVQLLEKSKFKNPKAKKFENQFAIKLVSELAEYPDLIKSMAKTYKVNLLPPYMLKVAGALNAFYSNSKIIGDENEESYVALIKATKTVLANAMKLMDLDIPDKM
ncbi:arginyl-tRNA synthetase [Metamycoplasma subdolum]|uniref:Arginine--tRNA ligase n=1 Tax=Metamycoplasma subdolum TaxID=92407 RepID=A0A3M0A9F3_9BACT|nr:arginine--tRNA ligase [Metamycoplasma subdolum]RMA79035.1 arginyl-tRNA synthetase [Metamycoplasma subdolum]WPB50558.1 arginine--tRNA ligase [Metamycoplasma subdolum]